MEPAVPFALLGAVLLLQVAAWVGVAVAALGAAGRPGSSAVRRPPALLVAGGALLLAAVQTAAALRFAEPESDLLAAGVAVGLLAVAGGVALGALDPTPRAVRVPAEVPGLASGSAVPGVVVPLGAAPAPAALGAVAALVAAGAVLLRRRDLAGSLLACGFAAMAVAAALAPAARDSSGASLGLLLARGAAAVLVLAGLAVLSRRSVLAKLVGAILVGVLAMAIAAVGVVGTVVIDAFAGQSARLVEESAEARSAALVNRAEAATAFTSIAQASCGRAEVCDAVLERFTARSANFALRVPRTGAPQQLGGRAPLRPSEMLSLAQSRLVRTALEGSGGSRVNQPFASLVQLAGSRPTVALAVAAPGRRPNPQQPPTDVFVYGIRLDDDFAREDRDPGNSEGYGLSILVGDQVVASNLNPEGRQRVERVARSAGAASDIGDGITVLAQGVTPSVRFVPLRGITGETVGVLALSRSASEALQAQRRVLRLLLLTALATTLLVAGLAVLLARRTVDPVRRLTAAAQRVAAGDLSASADVRSRDEIGTLSRTFDAMTGSLTRLTGDLRSAADQEVALRARLETVVASMSDGLLATDGSGRITNVNAAGLALVGLSAPEEALGRPLAEVVDLRDAAGARIDVLQPVEDVAGQLQPPDRAAVPVRAAVAPLASGGGVVLVLRDTTREREVERMKTEFLSNVSHELRTPLTPIRGYAEILATRSGLPPDRVTSFATTIRDESLRMNRVVDLLVDVAALEAGRVTVTPRPVAVEELLATRLSTWRTRAPDRAEDFRTTAEPGLPHVLVDPTWLGKALDELLDNAVKYSSTGCAVTLSAGWSPRGDRVRLAVRDEGCGISASDQEGLFTSFAQVDGSATRRVGGLGLGLSFVRRLADDAGFPLSMTSTVGAGSEFALDLPIAADQPAERPVAPGQPRQRRPTTAPGRVRRAVTASRRRPPHTDG